MNKKNSSGFSLFEILVVILLFAIIVAVANQAFFSALRGQNKSEATSDTKQSAHFVISTIERTLHSAQNVTACTSTTITYYDSNGVAGNFACEGNNIKQSGTAISSADTDVVACLFSCPQEGGKKTVIIDMTFEKRGVALRVDEKAQVQVKTQIRLRN